MVKSSPLWFRIALVVFSALLLLGLFSTELSDYDFWWTLKSGQYVAQQHRLPSPDPFAFTTRMAHDAYAGESITRQFNLTFEWLAQLMFYAVYGVAGFAGIILFRALLLSSCCALIGLIAWRRTGGYFTALAVAFLVAAVLYPNFAHDRSYLFTFFFLALTLVVLEYRRWLWALPVIALLWANCHGGFFLGWIAVAAYSAEPLFFQKQDRKLWLASGAFVLASALNPNGFRVIQVLAYFRQSFLQSKLLEWTQSSMLPISPFSVFLVTAAAVLLWARRRARITDWILFVLFTIAAMMAQRNIFLIGFWAPLMLASYLPLRSSLPRVLQFAAALLVAAGLGYGVVTGNFFQLRVAEWRFPAGAADFLLAHGVTSPMFNTYEFGGYLMWRLWPHERVFIDGRALSEEVFRDYVRILYNHSAADGGPTSGQLLDRYGIQTIVMNSFEYSEGIVYNLVPALSGNQTDWKLVYNDAQAVIFMRQPPPGVQPLDPMMALAHMEAECQDHLDHEPQFPVCARALTQVFDAVNQPAKAKKWIAYYLSLPHPKDPIAENTYLELVKQGK